MSVHVCIYICDADVGVVCCYGVGWGDVVGV